MQVSSCFFVEITKILYIDPRSRSTATDINDQHFHTYLSVLISFKIRQNKANIKLKILLTMGLAEWIIDDPYLFFFLFQCVLREIGILFPLEIEGRQQNGKTCHSKCLFPVQSV